MLITTVIVGIIVAAILLRVFEANPSNSIVEAVTDLARTLVGPFKDLFTIENAKVEIAVNWGLAALLYFIVGSLIARILRRMGVKSHPDRVVEAGDGIRTRTKSLEGSCAALTPRPRGPDHRGGPAWSGAPPGYGRGNER